jgi:hypothetical protein
MKQSVDGRSEDNINIEFTSKEIGREDVNRIQLVQDRKH